MKLVIFICDAYQCINQALYFYHSTPPFSPRIQRCDYHKINDPAYYTDKTLPVVSQIIQVSKNIYIISEITDS
jgi:hypothetical protein